MAASDDRQELAEALREAQEAGLDLGEIMEALGITGYQLFLWNMFAGQEEEAGGDE